MKVYISGAITNNVNYKKDFEIAEHEVREIMKCIPYNPARIELPPEADYEEYMELCFDMIDMCGAVYMLENWKLGAGANRELGYALGRDKIVVYQNDMKGIKPCQE